jgi:hypothetical protein
MHWFLLFMFAVGTSKNDDACNAGVCHTETLKNVGCKVALTRCLTDPVPVNVVALLTVKCIFVSQSNFIVSNQIKRFPLKYKIKTTDILRMSCIFMWAGRAQSVQRLDTC